MNAAQPSPIHRKDYKVPPFLIDETELDFRIGEDETIVEATLKVRRNPEAPPADSADLVLDGSKDLQTHEVELDGRALGDNEHKIEGDTLTVFGVPDAFELRTQVAIKPQDNTSLQGLYQSGDMLCTQCEAEGFRNITWYLDRPDVLSSFTTTISAPSSKYPVLLSNGDRIDGAEAIQGDAALHTVTWRDPHLKPAYLFALVAGDLKKIEDHFVTMSGRRVALEIYTEPQSIDKLDYAMESLKNAMRWDEEAYGREYDLDTYMIVATSRFNFGAMENKGLNIFNTALLLAAPETATDDDYRNIEAVVGHEYFHNWSGNRVTCRDWFQLSLKEGFTVMRDQQFSADMGSATVCRVGDVARLRSIQFPEDAGETAHPVRPDSYTEIDNFYTATVYEKGAEVVRMIRTLLGPELFRKGSDLYFERHDGNAVTIEDFVKAMEDVSGIDLSQFRNWYAQPGTPVVKVRGEFDEAKQTYSLHVEQSNPLASGAQPYHMPLKVGLLNDAGEDVRFEAASADVSSVEETDGAYSAVLHLNQAQQRFELKGVTNPPVPSLLRGFSAPVKLECDYDRDDLTFLMTHDSDGFNRWEASQRLGVDVIQEMVALIERGKRARVDERLIKAFEANLNQAVERNADETLDKEMLAYMLVLPAETYLIELADVANVDAIHQARQMVRVAIADALRGLLLSVYRLNQSGELYAPTSLQVGQRALKNLALGYLMELDDTDLAPVCVAQFRESANMTDSSAALRALITSPAASVEPIKEPLLTEMYNRWVDEPLVIDRWFAIQSGNPLPGAIDRVNALHQHEAFDPTSPNRVRALMVPFAVQNPVHFHDKSGDGYEFLADRVIELDPINSNMAARILAVSPMTKWRKFDKDRQRLMKGELARIREVSDLSAGVRELVNKSLGDEG